MRAGRDRALTHNTIAWGVVLSWAALVAAGLALFGRAHDAGSLPSYVASHKALKIALVEPAQQAQMEAPRAVAANTPPPVIAPEPQAPQQAQQEQQVAVLTGPVPLPHARPRRANAPVIAAVPLPRERVVEKAPELPAPMTVAAIAPENLTEAVAPSPQPSPASGLPNSGKPEFDRGEGEELVASAEPPSDAGVEAKADAPETTLQDIKTSEAAEAAPVPTTFGPARPAASFQLTSYAPTREQIFSNDITGSIGDPWRDLNEVKSTANAETTNESSPSPRPSPRKRGEGEVRAAALPPPRPAPETTKQLKLVKPRTLTIREKLWGSPVRLASLTPLDTDRDAGGSGGVPRPPFDRQTAVYVISEKKVYLPDGAVLEAHSGLGEYMDDPRYVRLRMRGATPPHVYALTMREALFHGVEAIRMTPLGGEEAIFGRAGILAHTYMLGPNGQSNGCVSFRDYDAFLHAFKAGRISRLAVLARLD